MKPNVTDFPSLVQWVADKYHGGVIDQISRHAGISPALASKWSKGQVRQPTLGTLEKFCKAYRLDFDWVRGLVRRTAAAVAVLLSLGVGQIGTCVADSPTPYAVGPSSERLTVVRLIGSWLVAQVRRATRTFGVRLSPIAAGASL